MGRNRNSAAFATKVIVYGAVFAALAAVLGQLLPIRPIPEMKFTLDKFLLFLSGVFFGPVVGGMIGFVAEFAGGNLFGVGFTPWLCFPAVFYGICGGLFRGFLSRKLTIPRLALSYLIPTVIGAVLVQSVALAWTYGPFAEKVWFNLFFRTIQFSVMMVVEVPLIYFLLKSRLFKQVGLWPIAKKQ